MQVGECLPVGLDQARLQVGNAQLGAVRLDDRLRPPQVRANVIRGNVAGQVRAEGPEPALIEGNNIQGGYPGAGNLDVDPRLDSAALPLSVASARYDGRTAVTTAQISVTRPSRT